MRLGYEKLMQLHADPALVGIVRLQMVRRLCICLIDPEPSVNWALLARLSS